MDIEVRLRKLESRYRLALSATIAAKARYLAILDEPGATPAAVERTLRHWQQLDSQRRAITARMAEVEAIEAASV
jgi:hypothetical protein